MTSASMKRIIWSIGWNIVWILGEFESFYVQGIAPIEISEFVFLLIWIIPLFLFKDDKEKKI